MKIMEQIKGFLRAWRGVWITAPSIAGMIIVLRLLGFLQSWEWAAFDQYMRLRPAETQDDRIVIVGISEADAKYLQQGYVADSVYARLIEKLKAKKPRAIGLDIYRDLPFQPGHEDLLKVFKSTPYLVGIEKVVPDRNGNTVPPPPVLKAQNQVGANDVINDADNKVRRGFIYLDNSHREIVYSFSLHLALRYLEKEGITVEDDEDGITWKLGKTVFSPFQANDGGYIRAKNGGHQILINYRGKAGHFDTVFLRDILEGKEPKDWGRDRIILIGNVGESFKDIFYTPYSGDLLEIPEPMPGVEVHAHLTSQLISAAMEGRPLIKSWPEIKEYLWIGVWAFIGATFTWQWRYMGKSWKLIILGSTLVLSAGVLCTITYIAFLWGWWLPVIPPLLALNGSVAVITTYIAHTADIIRKTFGRYLTDEVVTTLLESPEGLKIGGKRQTITVLTSDLRGFTALSEQLDPEEVVKILNIYLESMLDAIAQHHGTIDKFMGDGIVVLFGAPTTKENDPQRAVACAIAMQLATKNVNAKLQELNLPTIAMGIGINTGEMVVGNIGSEKHTEYTVIGKEMNLAFRIEGYSIGNQILIAEPTLTAIGKSQLRIDGNMKIQPKGIPEPITVYDVSGIKEPYNLYINKKPEIYCYLIEPIPITYQIVDGKNISAQIFTGHVIQISDTGAEVKIDMENNGTLPPSLSNIKLNIFNKQQHANEQKEDIYAKVLDKPTPPGHFYLQFTSNSATKTRTLFTAIDQSIANNIESQELI